MLDFFICDIMIFIPLSQDYFGTNKIMYAQLKKYLWTIMWIIEEYAK